MIRTEAEYTSAIERLQKDLAFLNAHRESLTASGLQTVEVERAMQPAIAFHEQLREEVDAYEHIVRGDISPIRDLTSLGRMLIGLRIASRISQRDLAVRLAVSESAVSRDERNEYHGITVERAQRILDALGSSVTVTAEPAITNQPLRTAAVG
jgi:N-acyl-D-aspartate/D-glutamate deacylase